MKRVAKFPYQLNVRVASEMGECIEAIVDDGYEDDKTDVLRTALRNYIKKLGYEYEEV